MRNSVYLFSPMLKEIKLFLKDRVFIAKIDETKILVLISGIKSSIRWELSVEEYERKKQVITLLALKKFAEESKKRLAIIGIDDRDLKIEFLNLPTYKYLSSLSVMPIESQKLTLVELGRSHQNLKRWQETILRDGTAESDIEILSPCGLSKKIYLFGYRIAETNFCLCEINTFPVMNEPNQRKIVSF